MATPSRIPSIRRGLVSAGVFATVAISVTVGCLDEADEQIVDRRNYPVWAASIVAEEDVRGGEANY